MTETETPTTTPTKRKPGRPRKIQPLEPTSSDPNPLSVRDSVTTLSAATDIDAESLAMESGFGMARSVGESANDLKSEQGIVDSGQKNPTEDAEPGSPAADFSGGDGEEFFEVEEPVLNAAIFPPDDFIPPSGDIYPSYGNQSLPIPPADTETPVGSLQPSGDLEIPLLVRELYVEALRDEAGVQGVSLRAHVQSLLDWWIENEFSITPANQDRSPGTPISALTAGRG